MTANDFTVASVGPFALNVRADTAEFFPGSRSVPALSVTRSRRAPVDIGVEGWLASPTGPRRWVESCAVRGVMARHVVSDLQPRATYDLHCDGQKVGSFKADGVGRIEFKRALGDATPQRFELLIQ
jgi:hypothetical protein